MFVIDLGDGAELRPLEPWQAGEFLEHMDRARASVDPWIPWAARSTDTDSATATLQRYADLAARDAGRIYGIWLAGTLVGGVMFVSFSTRTGVCEVGCWLEPAGTGRGLITRAVGLLLDWALGERGLYRAEWRCRPDNTASSNVARRLGMTLEGTLRGEFAYGGVRHDTQVWAVTAPEWAAKS
ncbi:GNAT family N-acetyltransferase [Couchioplanes caeruleus]|uniref:GNAT family N-acetyltransferase n=1 Tax=Couchioplanes caeruleus TaxID=56438 RepID=UPI0020C0AA4F|nr:GNAT family protein [Couchioplanes caeruleus]UQU62136.1 GNAT family N-acetyltransferase [Couchioplanes caeruleus]